MDKSSQEKRTAIAILLSILVIVIYNEVILPKPVPNTPTTSTGTEAATKDNVAPPAPTILKGTTGNPTTQSKATSPVEPLQPTANRIPTRAEYNASPTFSVETELYRAEFTTLGGRLKSFSLKGHMTSLKDKSNLELVTIKDSSLPLGVYVAGIQDASTNYRIPEGGVSNGAKVTGSTYKPGPSGEMSVLLEGTLPNGQTIRKTLRFVNGKYTFDIQANLDTASPDGSSVWLEWTDYVNPKDESLRWNPKQFIILESDSDITRTAPDSLDGPNQEMEAKWVAFGGSYFQTVIINNLSGVNTSIGKFGDTLFMRSRGTPTGGEFKVYIGPKNREMLRDYGNELHMTVDLGWFAFVGEPILKGIHLLYGLLGNYGLAIIALTLLIKTALLPLTKTSFKSMKAMQDLQPEMKALKERIKDPSQLNQEVMKLYQKRGVNPLGGCFPMILQMPIFLGMYNALQRDIDLRHAPFALWVNDLSAPEGLNILGITVPVMILLMGASMLWQQITTPSAADPAQKKAMYAVPVVFTVMFVLFPFPSGLVLYWLVNNIISIVQQMALRSEKGANPLKATLIGSVTVFIIAYVLTLL